MKRIFLLAALAAVGTLAWAGSAAADTTVLSASLDGDAEVPKKGDSNGEGSAVLRVDDERNRVCYTIRTSGVGTTAAGHVHRGSRGKAGPIVIPLFTTTSTKPARKGCASDVRPSVISALLRKPGGYYVNLHNAAYPDGAVRGQLTKGIPEE